MEKVEININNVKYDFYTKSPNTSIQKIILICNGFSSRKEEKDIIEIIKVLTDNNYGVVFFDIEKKTKFFSRYKEKLVLSNLQEKIKNIYSFIKEKYPDTKIEALSSRFGAFVTLTFMKNFDVKFDRVVLNTPAINIKYFLKNKLDKRRLVSSNKIDLQKLSRKKREEITDLYNEITKNNIYGSNYVYDNIVIIHNNNNDSIDYKSSEQFIKNNCTNSYIVKRNSKEKVINYILKELMKE